jgi:hypothetical protein
VGGESVLGPAQLHGMTEKRHVEGALSAFRHDAGLGGVRGDDVR